jgi:hypothetical protein
MTIEEKVCPKCGLMTPHIRGACLMCQEVSLTDQEIREVQFWAERGVARILGKVKAIGPEAPDYERDC